MPLADWQRDGATVRFERSGWFLVRAIASEEKTFRFASTAPFYVEIGPEKERFDLPQTVVMDKCLRKAYKVAKKAYKNG